MKNKIALLIIMFGLMLFGCDSSSTSLMIEEELQTPISTRTSTPTIEPDATATQTITPSPTRPFIDPIMHLNIEYIPDAAPTQKLDVYLPAEGQGPYPTILAIHGGGFVSLTKGVYRQFANQFAQWGYATVSTNYRLAPRYSYPAQVEDVFCALAWVHANHEEYNLDPQRIIVTGGSAGGYLAAMIGTVDDPTQYLNDCPYTLPEEEAFQGVVAFYARFDLRGFEGDTDLDNLEAYLGAKYEEVPAERLAEISPIVLLDGSERPFLLIHGTEDYVVPSWTSEDFATALEEKEIDVELLLLEVPHYFEIYSLDHPLIIESYAAMVNFMEKVFED